MCRKCSYRSQLKQTLKAQAGVLITGLSAAQIQFHFIGVFRWSVPLPPHVSTLLERLPCLHLKLLGMAWQEGRGPRARNLDSRGERAEAVCELGGLILTSGY